MTVVPLEAADPARVGPLLAGAVSRVVLGKQEAVRLVVAAVLAGGHVLLEDAPGVGKTLLAKALARTIGAPAGRVQGTPDLLPSDVTGVSVYEPGAEDPARRWTFHPGPLFHHVLLVDEINRATPRAQSALLEAMQEGQVTVDGTTHALPVPFVVLATQNPEGDAGTFPLVPGQSDRFAVAVSLGLPSRDAERALLLGEGGLPGLHELPALVEPAALRAAQAATGRLHAHPAIVEYVLDLVAATRQQPGLAHGVSPRAAQALLAVARGHACVDGRTWVLPDDVKAVAGPVLAHRLAAAGRTTTTAARRVVEDLVAAVPVPVA